MTLLNSSYNRGYDPGKTDLSPSLFPQPILTSQISFGDIIYVADPMGSDLKWNLGHTVHFNLELFGCDNYQIDSSKLKRHLVGWQVEASNFFNVQLLL